MIPNLCPFIGQGTELFNQLRIMCLFNLKGLNKIYIYSLLQPGAACDLPLSSAQTLSSTVDSGYATLSPPQVSQLEATLAQVSLPKYLGKGKAAGQGSH